MNTVEPKKAYERREAHNVACEIIERMKALTERIEVAGSLRRERSHVKDIEILFVPITAPHAADLFAENFEIVAMTEPLFNEWLRVGYIIKRLSVDGKPAWGPKNKLALHTASGIPVDFFATTHENWWNSLVVRTGGKRSNLQITIAANKKGWSFEAYGSGFKNLRTGEHRRMFSEQDIFSFVGLPYREPVLRP